MPDIVATCIVLHNLCIVNKEGIKNDWIVEAKNKLSKKRLMREKYEKLVNYGAKGLELLK
jgi:hypothetical protein